MLFWKKALSVTLCLAVLLSVMVVGAGAAFSDQNQITHKDAVNRCVSLNIIGGYPDGSYQPKSNITRAEACKILCVTLTGGSEGSLSVPAYPTFTDVRTDRSSSWAEKYITACAAQGIVSGTGGGKFEPSASVTATQLAKMLLTAMGYDAAKYGFTGAAWAANVNRYGELEGLFTNLAGLNKDAALSRDDAAQMLVNAMDADADLYGRGVDAEDEAPVQAHPRPSYLVDYLGMTVDQVAAIWGRDYIYIGGWYAGSALGFYYEDWRVPCTFYVNDLSYRGFADGNDLIFLLSCPADSEIPLAEGIPSNSTYPQLQAAGITGEFYTGEDANSGYGESASLYYQYNSAIMIEFCWYEESDPYTMPPEEIFIISLSVDT